MTSHPLRRSLALLVSASLLASLTVAMVAAPASAARPKCQGKTATIVGTGGNDILRGTARRDIIVALGGNDRIYAKGGNDLICAGNGNDRVFGGVGADTIWGQAGNDILNGNAGNDFVAGQVGNDTINGGIDVDTCYQGPGVGTVSNCELPAAPPMAPPPAAPLPAPTVLAIAYSDLDGSNSPTAGDVLISQVVDTNCGGLPSPGDTVELDRYPTNLDASTFAEWGKKRHTVSSVDATGSDRLKVVTESGVHSWYRNSVSYQYDWYVDINNDGSSEILDYVGSAVDLIRTEPASPSEPPGAINLTGGSSDDDRLIDVELYYVP